MNDQGTIGQTDMPPSTKTGVKVALAVVLVPIAIVLVFIYVKGFHERDLLSNLFYAAFAIWLPLMYWLEKTIPRLFFEKYLPPVLAEQAQEHGATAISISLVFSILTITPEMTAPQAIWTYIWYFFAMLTLFVGGILFGIAASNIWGRFRRFFGPR
ncbi:MAG: hypothetical protein ABJ251_11385 [Paracoccaceae bacterium]